MKIEVDTQFNIGDTVYIPETCMHWWVANSEPLIITDVQITYTDRCAVVFYGLNNSHVRVREDKCFITFEECRQWCQERNEKDGVL